MIRQFSFWRDRIWGRPRDNYANALVSDRIAAVHAARDRGDTRALGAALESVYRARHEAMRRELAR